MVYGQDVTLQSLSPQGVVDRQVLPLVFVGYGIHAPERHWDDYKDVDLAGKIAVVLINDAVPVYRPRQLVLERGQGARLWDTQGREFIDLA
ncbi:hypothetical protein K9F17_20950, partial [Stenotrophomonas acidaminiphila]|nr:hypothetical protein [Stenotrophomonas acidaminiphila]